MLTQNGVPERVRVSLSSLRKQDIPRRESELKISVSCRNGRWIRRSSYGWPPAPSFGKSGMLLFLVPLVLIRTIWPYALGMMAKWYVYETKYICLLDVLVEVAISRVINTYQEIVKRCKKVTLLILDEWLFYSLKETEAKDWPELVEARSKAYSTTFCHISM